MRRKYFILSIMLIIAVSLMGCAMFRHNIIPQDTKGPHGGSLTLIDQRIPEYVEFVVIPGDKEWTFQIYFYNIVMEPKSISGSGHLMVSLPSGDKKEIGLWNTKPFLWSKGIGHLENKMELNDVKEFTVETCIQRGRTRECLSFKYPY